MSFYELGRYDLAFREFEQLRKDPSAAPVACLFLGMIAGKKQHHKEAVALLERANGLIERYPSALLALARAHYELRQPGKSEQLLRRLRNLLGLLVADLLEAGVLYSRLERYGDALEMLNRARGISPAGAGIACRLAFVLDKLGRTSEALEILQQSTKPELDGECLNLLGQMAEKGKKLDLATQALRKAIEIEPDKRRPLPGPELAVLEPWRQRPFGYGDR